MAQTLSYALPDAETEIRRLNERHRALQQAALSKYRRTERPEHVQFKEWLDEHPAASLEEAGLAAGIEDPVASVAVTHGTQAALDRYVIRGDLQEWLDRVAQLDEAAAADPGTWGATEMEDVDLAIRDAIQRNLTRDLERRRSEQQRIIAKMCQMLSFVSEREFKIDTEFVHDELEQLKRLSEMVEEWHGYITINGHPRREVEALVKQRHEEAARRRAAEMGIRAAARAGSSTLLTDQQLDQVLLAFYEQRQPEGMFTAKDKARCERRMIEALSKEEINSRLVGEKLRRQTTRCEELEALVLKLTARIEELESLPTMDAEKRLASVEQMNTTTRVIAEVLARTKLRQAQTALQHMATSSEKLRVEHDANLATIDRLTRENAALRHDVDRFAADWTEFLVAKQRDDEERIRLQGGQKSDILHLATVLNDLVGTTSATMTRVVALAAEMPSAGEGALAARRSKTQLLEVLLQWTDNADKIKLGDGARVLLVALRQALRRNIDDLNLACTDAANDDSNAHGLCSPAGRQAAAYSPRSTVDVVSPLDANYSEKALVDDVVRRLDHAGSDLVARHREARLARRTIDYFVRCVDAMIAGTYDDEKVGLRPRKGGATTSSSGASGDDASTSAPVAVASFPPRAVSEPDENYVYAWAEEFKQLERCFTQLKINLVDGADPSSTKGGKPVFRALGSTAQRRQDALRQIAQRLDNVADLVHNGKWLPQGGATHSATALPAGASTHGGRRRSVNILPPVDANASGPSRGLEPSTSMETSGSGGGAEATPSVTSTWTPTSHSNRLVAGRQPFLGGSADRGLPTLNSTLATAHAQSDPRMMLAKANEKRTGHNLHSAKEQLVRIREEMDRNGGPSAIENRALGAKAEEETEIAKRKRQQAADRERAQRL